MNRLSASGPLTGFLEEHLFDTGKLKSSSIVSFGVKHLVKIDGNDSLFKIWNHPTKTEFGELVQQASKGNKKNRRDGNQKAALESYISFCTESINNILAGYRSAVQKPFWTLDKKISRAATATAINGVIFGLRELLREGKVPSADEYVRSFSQLNIDFTPKKFKFKSSNWVLLERRLLISALNDRHFAADRETEPMVILYSNF